MATAPCLVLYGNSVFLAGIQAQLEGYTILELISVEAGCPDARELIRARRPRAVLFDLTLAQPDFAIPLLRERPDLLLVGVDPSSNQMLVLSSHPAQALSIADLLEVIHQKESNSVYFPVEGKRKRQSIFHQDRNQK